MWFSIEVFDGASSASLWADAYGDSIIGTSSVAKNTPAATIVARSALFRSAAVIVVKPMPAL